MIFYFDRFSEIEPFSHLTNDQSYSYSVRWLWNYLANLSFFMVYAIIGGLIWIGSNSIYKDYYFFIAKGSSEYILERTGIEKVRYAIRALKYFNKYLGKVLNLQINDINGVISKLLSDPEMNRYAAIRSVYDSFQRDDKLEPITYIVKELDIQNAESFLKSQSLVDKMKTWVTYIIASVIPTVISVIQLIWSQ